MHAVLRWVMGLFVTIELAAGTVRAYAATDNLEEIISSEPQATELIGSEKFSSEYQSAPPAFVRNKHPLPEYLVKQKREHRYITPMPVIAWDPDTGFNFGALVNLYDNGSKENPLFRYTPYRQQIAIAAIFTTTKYFQVGARYDQPYLLDTPWRVQAELEFFRNPVQNYFGIGNNGQQLVNPWNGQVYGSYDDYKDALNQVANGQTYGKYDDYRLSRLSFQAAAEYDIFGGLVRPLAGIRVAHFWIHDYTGSSVNNAVELPTHLAVDCTSGRAIGCGGGLDNYVKLGFTFDTRNFEPDPSSGILAQTFTEFSPKFLGSALNYGRWTTSLSGYGTLLSYKIQQLVLAGRFAYNWQFGDIPFYTMDTLAFNERDRFGLGGLRTLHGYRQNRFIGPVATVFNTDLRWSFTQFRIFKQDIKMMAVPFFDAGRAYNSNSDITLRDWKFAGGIGLRLAWNLSTIVTFDYGISAEGKAFYMDLSHPF